MTRTKPAGNMGSSAVTAEVESISSFQSLGLNVLSLLLATPSIASSYIDLIPSLSYWIGDLKENNQAAWIDAVQCLLYIMESVSKIILYYLLCDPCKIK